MSKHSADKGVLTIPATLRRTGDAVVRVCPTRDVECGYSMRSWCTTCPKWKDRPRLDDSQHDADKAQGVE